jgi:signal transduction histidine kinase
MDKIKTANDNSSLTRYLIAAGRILLGISLLVYVFKFIPGQEHYPLRIYYLLGIYLCYSITVILFLYLLKISANHFMLLRYCIDLSVFLLFYHVSASVLETTYFYSVFLLFTTFLLFSASLWWQLRGAIITSVIIIAIVAVCNHFPFTEDLQSIKTIHYLSIAAIISLMSIILGATSGYAASRHRELAFLAQWPNLLDNDTSTVATNLLKHVAAIFNVSKVLLVWEEFDEPWLHVFSCFQGECAYSREVSGRFGRMVAEPLTDAHFFSRNLRSPKVSASYFPTSPKVELRKMRGMPVNSELLERFPMKSVLSTVLRGEMFTGRLFVIDCKGRLCRRFELVQIVSREMTNFLDQFYLLRDLKHLVLMEERSAMARDLHDGILQNLAGVNLQLERIEKSSTLDAAGAKNLSECRVNITNTMREIRSHINELRPSPWIMPAELDGNLADHLREMTNRLMHQWDISVGVEVTPQRVDFPAALARGICNIVHEAIANAARHANASTVKIAISAEDGWVNIIISNNGSGFPFRGRYEHVELKTMQRGPQSLMERAESLGGGLVIESGDVGSTLEFSLPITSP